MPAMNKQAGESAQAFMQRLATVDVMDLGDPACPLSDCPAAGP